VTRVEYGLILNHRQFPHGSRSHGNDLTISGNLKSFEGPVLNGRDSTKHRALDLNELVFDEIRSYASAIFPIFISTLC
jgi:hypothetical protein